MPLLVPEMCAALKVNKGHQSDDAKLQEATKKLEDLATDLQEKASICLLFLHLEVSAVLLGSCREV